jgi:hypothetical protein
MCGGGDAKRAAAEAQAARAEQERLRLEREGKIRQGAQSIDQAFAGFDDGYFDDYRRTVVDYGMPQVQDQYNDSFGKLVAALAGRGMLESTVGANQTSRLNRAFDTEKARVADDATTMAQELRGRVQAQKGDLLALNTATADPTAISAQARGAATSLAAPPPTSRFERLFADVVEPYVAGVNARNNAAPPRRTSTAPVASGGGSGRLVR